MTAKEKRESDRSWGGGGVGEIYIYGKEGGRVWLGRNKGGF